MSDPTPTPKEVERLHKFDDVDAGKDSHHHTLGPNRDQAASGTHRDHVLSTSIVGSKASFNATLINSIIAALVELGAKDATT